MRPQRRFIPLFCLAVSLGGWVLAACAGAATPIPSGGGNSPTPAVVQPSSTYAPVPVTVEFTPTPAPDSPALTPTEASLPSPTPGPACQDEWCVYAGHFWLQRPVAGSLGDGIDPSYRYGETQNGAREPHSGVEFPAQHGDPVQAAADGTVVVAGDDKTISYSERAGFYGNLVILEHRFDGLEDPVFTLYAHLSEVGVVVGQTVAAGDRLGAVGATGWANGPHLHFEVRVGSIDFKSIRNPELWLIPRVNGVDIRNGAVAGRLISLDGFDIEVETITLAAIVPEGGAAFYLKPYDGKHIQSDETWRETFALGEIPPGDYQWSFVARGKLWKGTMPVQPGKVTVFQVGVE